MYYICINTGVINIYSTCNTSKTPHMCYRCSTTGHVDVISHKSGGHSQYK